MAARLTPIQRLVLRHVLACAKKGQPAIIVSGHRKTRVVEFQVKEASGFVRLHGIATNSTTLYFLMQHQLLERVEADQERYRLTPKGEAALDAAPLSGVHTTEAQWKRRTETKS